MTVMTLECELSDGMYLSLMWAKKPAYFWSWSFWTIPCSTVEGGYSTRAEWEELQCTWIAQQHYLHGENWILTLCTVRCICLYHGAWQKGRELNTSCANYHNTR